MEAADFEQSNHTMDTPKGASPDAVAPLRVYRGAYPDGVPLMVACFKPTRAELDEIERTGRVWLQVLSHKMPPMAITSESPFVLG